MKSTLDHRDGRLCILNESGGLGGALETVREWYVVREAAEAEIATLIGRPVKHVEPSEGLYVDEQGNVYQLADKCETKPIAVEHLRAEEKTELEVLLEASLNGKKGNEQNGGAKKLLKKNRRSGRKQQALQMVTAKPEARPEEASPVVETSASAFNIASPEDPVHRNLRQKLAEVRRRIGYVQKRGHNERFNYSYVTGADIAGSVGDLLSKLGVVVHPPTRRYLVQSAVGRGEITRMTRVVRAYTCQRLDRVAGNGPGRNESRGTAARRHFRGCGKGRTARHQRRA